jgi:hypothetical protein
VLEEYFLLVEERYRSNSLQLIQKRLSLEDPKIQQIKRTKTMPKQRFPSGPAVYILGLFDANGNLIHLKHGYTDNLQNRVVELNKLYYNFLVRILYFHPTKNPPLAVEQCSFGETPQELASPFDREITDSSFADVVESIEKCDAFMTKRKKVREDRYKTTHRSVRNDNIHLDVHSGRVLRQ